MTEGPLGNACAAEHVVSCSIGGHWTRSHVQESEVVRVTSGDRKVAKHPQLPRTVRHGLRTGNVSEGTKNLEMADTRPPSDARSAGARPEDKVEAASGLDERLRRSGTRTGIPT